MRPSPARCRAAQGERAGQWRSLLAAAVNHERAPEGQRVTFPFDLDLAADIARLAVAEQECCSFYDFALQVSAGALVLTVRAPEAATALLTDLFGDLT